MVSECPQQAPFQAVEGTIWQRDCSAAAAADVKTLEGSAVFDG